jgi:hypothetical protein
MNKFDNAVLSVKTGDSTCNLHTEIWSLTWANDGRALFRLGQEITPGETHIIWEAIGTPAETYGRMR